MSLAQCSQLRSSIPDFQDPACPKTFSAPRSGLLLTVNIYPSWTNLDYKFAGECSTDCEEIVVIGEAKNRLKTVALGALASVLAVMVFSQTAAAQPSWCGGSNLNDAEAAICDTRSLWGADGALETAFRRARSDSPRQANAIRDRQRAWLNWRNACGYNVQCLRRRYDEQIGWLEGFFNN